VKSSQEAASGWLAVSAPLILGGKLRAAVFVKRLPTHIPSVLFMLCCVPICISLPCGWRTYKLLAHKCAYLRLQSQTMFRHWSAGALHYFSSTGY
jgi:hypothetical protein